jgi:hypothetical protein
MHTYVIRYTHLVISVQGRQSELFIIDTLRNALPCRPALTFCFSPNSTDMRGKVHIAVLRNRRRDRTILVEPEPCRDADPATGSHTGLEHG